MSWKVPYTDLSGQYLSLKPQIDSAVQRVLASGKYTSGPETERFELLMAKYLGVKHVIAVGNGRDALYLSFRSLDPPVGVWGENVGTDEYTHVSTHNAIRDAGGRPVFGMVGRVRVPVHMNGRFNPEALTAETVIEDACQAIGTAYKTRKAGTFGLLGCFSCHPLKVLGCAGDGGFVATNYDYPAEVLRVLRNNKTEDSVNSRMDEVQAAILNVKLPYLDAWIKRRREIAAIYEAQLPEWVKKPPAPSDGDYFDTYSSYVIGGSPELLSHLRGRGIECFSHIREDVVSLPIYPEMKEGHIAMVIAAVRSYTNG